MEQYNVTGMSCAACSARVEKAVKKVPGVTSCSDHIDVEVQLSCILRFEWGSL